MAGNQGQGRPDATAGGPLRKLSLWFQRTMNVRTTGWIRRKGGRYLGMDMLILHTTGRRTGQPRETPITWFADGEDAWLVVASGGGDRNPDWYANLVAHPENVAVELHGRAAVPVTPQRLDGDARAQAWQHITATQPRYDKYQRKSDREYPVVRLTPR
ncbi:nitroreductase family deazaflavin-dependent oxidoreductase [Nocardia sienata]|uniref:nitroreductase family deazaflavin-dependent oxidoreductase n=1 Tax=Nocardia sienata TaxID=248552 RepID=UPI0007A5451B